MRSTTKTREPVIIIPPKQTMLRTNGTRRRMKKPRLLSILLSLLALIALIHYIAVTHPWGGGVVPTNCLGLIRTTDYAQMVHLQSSSQVLGAVQIVSQLDGGAPAALVGVTRTDSQRTLDVYMFGCSARQHKLQLATLFTQRGLIQGTVAISSANTLITGELDITLSPQEAMLLQPQQGYVYREYHWQNGKFVQVSFPGLYPVTSRSEAEVLQQQANGGQFVLWRDPLLTAKQMARDIFKWPAKSVQSVMLNNNGVTAQVRLIQPHPQMQVLVTLQRLVQQNKTGLWFVTGAQTGGMIVKQPGSSGTVLSPTTIQGTGALANGHATATLFDHTLTPLSLLNNPTLNVDADGTFEGMLFYINGIQDQQGLLLIESLPPNGSGEMGQLLLIRVII